MEKNNNKHIVTLSKNIDHDNIHYTYNNRAYNGGEALGNDASKSIKSNENIRRHLKNNNNHGGEYFESGEEINLNITKECSTNLNKYISGVEKSEGVLTPSRFKNNCKCGKEFLDNGKEIEVSITRKYNWSSRYY